MADIERPMNAVITGGVRNIGKEIGLYLAKAEWGRAGDPSPGERNYSGANLVIGYRTEGTNTQRKNAKMIEAIEAAGVEAVAVRGDLTDDRQRAKFVRIAGEWAAERGGVDLLVLNAAGGLEEETPEYGYLINDTAQTATLRELTPYLADEPTIMLVESSWSELYPKLGGPVLPGYREKVAATKKRGRDNVVAIVENEFVPIGGRALILAAGIVDGSAIGKMAEEGFPDFYQEQKDMGNVVSIKEVADRAAAIANDASLPHGHVEWIGASPEALLARYPAEAA